MIDFKEVKDLIFEVANLTGSVRELKDRVQKSESDLSDVKDAIRDLKADMRVARAELETEATKAAVSTVVQTYDQMVNRLQVLEDQLRRLPPPE